MTSILVKANPSVVDLLVTPDWPLKVIDVVRKMKVPKGCTDEEFYVFMRQAQASGMNPLLGQCYCVPRRTNIAEKGQPANWVTNHVFQVAIDGMRARAARHPDFISSSAADVWEGDTVKLNIGMGQVVHEINPMRRGSRIVGAWGRVEKRGAIPVVAWLPASARSGDSSFWSKDPGGMLAKNAEALAFRRAYPTEFEGTTGAGDFEQIGEPDAAPAPPTRLESLAAAAQATPPPPEGPVVLFGVQKGRAIANLTRGERLDAIEEGMALLRKTPLKGKALERMEANLSALTPETGADVVDVEVVPERQDLPMSHPDAQPPDEPGSEG